MRHEMIRAIEFRNALPPLPPAAYLPLRQPIVDPQCRRFAGRRVGGNLASIPPRISYIISYSFNTDMKPSCGGMLIQGPAAFLAVLAGRGLGEHVLQALVVHLQLVGQLPQPHPRALVHQPAAAAAAALTSAAAAADVHIRIQAVPC